TVALEGRTRAFLKLQEGCDQFCSFCIVPFSRGRSRSVDPRRVITALDGLHAQGFKEVILTGVHLGGYGVDLDPPITLATLLEMIEERAAIPRLRLSSLDPEELSDRIIDLVAASNKFCPHFHLPLQAGEDETLRRMRRRYDREAFRERVGRLTAAMPEVAIGTDLIAGFPGESSRNFESYFKFVESLPLAYFHVFPYSIRAGTTAAKLPDQVAPSEIKRRAAALRQLGDGKRRAFADRFRGARLKVLLEDNDTGAGLRGYSRNYLRVLTEAGSDMRNQEVDVEVSRSGGAGAELVGEVIRLEAAGSP
ncbi:MAG: MiaB/RimO family radical SAM methylthiotransferase, partial [Candidatus Binataceae bacterium]